MVQSISTPARHAHSCAKPHRPCPSHCSAIVSCLSCAKPHQACPSHCNAIRSCSIARETASSMPILLQHHRVMPNRMRKVVAHAHLAATSSCDAQWGTESCPGRIGPPNTRMQLTAFGARDRRYFKAILCRVPSAATDAQHVGPRHQCLAIQQAVSMIYFVRRMPSDESTDILKVGRHEIDTQTSYCTHGRCAVAMHFRNCGIFFVASI